MTIYMKRVIQFNCHFSRLITSVRVQSYVLTTLKKVIAAVELLSQCCMHVDEQRFSGQIFTPVNARAQVLKYRGEKWPSAGVMQLPHCFERFSWINTEFDHHTIDNSMDNTGTNTIKVLAYQLGWALII